jgi:hypothetical protein
MEVPSTAGPPLSERLGGAAPTGPDDRVGVRGPPGRFTRYCVLAANVALGFSVTTRVVTL